MRWHQSTLGSGPPVGKVNAGVPPPVDSPLGVVGPKPVGPLGVVEGPLGVVDGPLGVVEGPLGVVEGPLEVVKGVKEVVGPAGVGGVPPEGVAGLSGVGGVPPEGVGGLGGVPPPCGAGGVPAEGGGGPPVAWPQHPGHVLSLGPYRLHSAPSQSQELRTLHRGMSMVLVAGNVELSHRRTMAAAGLLQRTLGAAGHLGRPGRLERLEEEET